MRPLPSGTAWRLFFSHHLVTATGVVVHITLTKESRMKKHTRLIAALALIPAAALALSACSSGGQPSETPGETADTSAPAELTTVTVGTVGLTSDGALIAGMEQGFFEEEGLKIETSIVQNPPAGLAAAQGGQLDITFTPGIPLLNALSQGIGVQVIAASHGYDPAAKDSDDPGQFDDTGLFASAKSGITTIEELEGRTIAIPARKAHLEVVIADELQEAGIDPETGVNWVVLDFTSAVAALNEGTVDAAGLVSPFTTQALEAGNPQISAPSVAFFDGGTTSYWVAGTSTIEQKPEIIAAFQRAIVKSNEWANEHPEEAIQAGLTYTNSPLTVADVMVPYWTTDVAPKNLETMMNKMVKLKFLAAPVDLSNAFHTQ